MDKCEFLSTMFTQEMQFISMYISQNKTLYWIPYPLPRQKKSPKGITYGSMSINILKSEINFEWSFLMKKKNPNNAWFHLRDI